MDDLVSDIDSSDNSSNESDMDVDVLSTDSSLSVSNSSISDDDSETSNNSSSSSTVSETFFDVVDSDIDRNSESSELSESSRTSELSRDENQQSAESSTSQQLLKISKPNENPTILETNNESIKENDVFTCPICLEGFTTTGSHKPACLKCGHIFGENCLERWLKVGSNRDTRRCPTCNTKASLNDIRILYAKQLVAVDTAELTALEHKLLEERRTNSIMKAEADKFKAKNDYLVNEVNKLKCVIEEMKAGHKFIVNSTNSSNVSRKCLKHIHLCKTPGCRVLAFNKDSMLLVASQHSESPLFPSHVIRKINAAILTPSKECIYAHKKQIRDMSFHPVEHNLLASVGLDKCINLIDLSSNNVVSSIEVEEPLWSCCWAGNNSNVLIAGSQSGSLFYIDKRFMKLLNSQYLRKPACVSLVSLPPSNTRSFINGGFLKTRMDTLSVLEHSSGQCCTSYIEKELPLKGLWTSTFYDSNSNLILSSAKPCGNNKSIRHIVSKISNFNEGPEIQPVVTFYGGTRATHLSRSCIISSNQSCEDTFVCSYDENAKMVKLFSVNSNSNVHNFPVNENIIDLCPLNDIMMDGKRAVAGLSETGISLFSV